MANDPEALIRRWFEEVWNQGREATVDEMMSPDVVVHGLGSDQQGPDEFKTFYRAYRDAFPDFTITVEAVVTRGDLVAARWTGKATHLGNGLGFPATGKPVQATGMVFVRFANGKLVEGWNNYDLLGILQQVGAVSLPG